MLIRFLSKLLVCVFAVLPLGAYASFEMSEIMYDVPDADSGREWIEIHNTGSIPLDASEWKLFENGTNHALLGVRGSLVLGGGYAVIADDAEKFFADWPNYTGILLTSSFSLRNKGEALALKNASSTVVASYTYEPTAGAKGNGNTLNLLQNAFVERAPSPGGPALPAPLPAQTAPEKARNPTAKVSVQKDDSAEPSREGGAVSIQKSGAVAGTFGAFQDGAFSGMIPWILALLGVIAFGACAIFFMKKESGSGYTITEDNDG
ncbi:lamin tail domain-containing protein [Patescibacteria group bacterium]|nr:lamin tail domain-containing protein [Patescibacteria group bacterium]